MLVLPSWVLSGKAAGSEALNDNTFVSLSYLKDILDSLSNGVQSLFDSSLFDSTCSSICEENESVISSSPDVKSSESFSKKSDIPVLSSTCSSL